jgi:hypothetical protein
MAVKTSSMTGTISERLNAALKLPNGARFYQCALQVNPGVLLSDKLHAVRRATP